MHTRRILIGSYIVLLIVFLAASGSWFLEAHTEYKQLKVTEAENEQLLADAKKRLADHEKILERLRTDPAYVEKVMRKWFYARPGEVIFRFEDE